MTTPLRQPALDSVNALADDLDGADTALALANNQITSLNATITDLRAQLAAQQGGGGGGSTSSTLFGSSLSMRSGETWAQGAARIDAAFGHVPVLRVYDAANGSTWLYNKLHDNGLLDGKRKICASIKHFDSGDTNLINAVDYITIDHEPDQQWVATGGQGRTPASTLAPLLHQFRSKIDAAGRTGKCKLMLILTGTQYGTRLPVYMDAVGSGVVDVLGVDPYAASGTAAGLVKPLLTVAAQYKLPVAVTEIGMKTGTDPSILAPFVSSQSALRGLVEFVTWFNQAGSANLGNELDNVPALAAAQRAVNS